MAWGERRLSKAAESAVSVCLKAVLHQRHCSLLRTGRALRTTVPACLTESRTCSGGTRSG